MFDYPKASQGKDQLSSHKKNQELVSTREGIIQDLNKAGVKIELINGKITIDFGESMTSQASIHMQKEQLKGISEVDNVVLTGRTIVMNAKSTNTLDVVSKEVAATALSLNDDYPGNSSVGSQLRAAYGFGEVSQDLSSAPKV